MWPLLAVLLLAPVDSSNPEDSVVSWNKLGNIHQAQSKLDEAERDYRQALALNRALATPDPLEDASILNNLATILQARRDFKGADTLLREGCAIIEENNLNQGRGAGPLLSNLALNLQQQGKLQEAERAYREAEVAFENSSIDTSADFAMFLSNFGLLSFEIGHYAEGISRQRRALEVQAKLPSVNIQQRAYILNNLGLGLEQAEQFPEATSTFLRAIELERGGPPALTRHLVESLNNLAVLEEKLGRYVDARTHQLESEKIASTLLSSDDPIWATIWNNLGMIAILQRDRREAKRQFDRSAALWLRTTGPASPQYSATLSNIASLESARGHHKQSQEMAARSLEIDRAFFGQDHPRIATDLANLALELFYRNKVEDAIALLLRAKAIQEKSPGQGNLSLARTLDDLATTHQKIKRFTEAKQFYEQAIQTYEAQQATSLPQYAACLHQYAALLRQMRDFANAEQVEVRATRVDVQGALSGQSTLQSSATGFR